MTGPFLRLTLAGLLAFLAIRFTEASPPAPEDVMDMPPSWVERLETEVGATAQSPEARVDRLVDFISNDGGLGFRYRATPTTDVARTIADGRGNCLSFTLLFLSAARALGVDAYAREVRMPATWRADADLIVDIGHVNIGIDAPGLRRTIDFEPDPMLSRRLAAPYRGRRISDERALAHFYNNRAAELMTAGELEQAAAWAEQALAIDDGFATAHNTAGVIERRRGHPARARQHFRAALELAEDPSSVLFNLVRLERAEGRREAAAVHARRLEALHPDDPWFLWSLGRFYESLDEPLRAEAFHARAARLGGGEYRFHASLARVLYTLGRDGAAAESVIRAAELKATAIGDTRQAKLDVKALIR